MEDNEVHLLNAKPDVVHETAPPKSRWSRLQRALPLWVAFLVSCWWLAAIGVTLIMKQTVGSDAAIFPFPIMLTGLTNAFTGILAFQSGRVGLLALRSASMPPLKSAERIKLLAIGLMMGIEIAATNKSLEFLTVRANYDEFHKCLIHACNYLVLGSGAFRNAPPACHLPANSRSLAAAL